MFGLCIHQGRGVEHRWKGEAFSIPSGRRETFSCDTTTRETRLLKKENLPLLEKEKKTRHRSRQSPKGELTPCCNPARGGERFITGIFRINRNRGKECRLLSCLHSRKKKRITTYQGNMPGRLRSMATGRGKRGFEQFLKKRENSLPCSQCPEKKNRATAFPQGGPKPTSERIGAATRKKGSSGHRNAWEGTQDDPLASNPKCGAGMSLLPAEE